ncbi:MAG: hypothetical protein AB1813_29685, partial [Verrucomicrobiota bacterium]
MTNHEQEFNVTLPESLREQFLALERRLWKVETLMAIGLALGGLAVAYLLQFVSDRVWDSPKWLRSGLALGALLTAAGAAVWWLR